MKNILVPTDFSRFARRAADRAIWLGATGSCRIHLVHVLPGAATGAPARTEAARSLARECNRLNRQIARASIPRVSVTATSLRGEAYVEIIRHAREIDADIVALGCKGTGERPLKVLGRTAARVARMADIPVLVVRKSAKGPYRRPLIALPLDPSSRRLVKLVETIVDPAAVPLPVVRAYNVPFPGLIGAGTERMPTAFHKEFRGKAEAVIRAQLKTLARGGAHVRPILRWGDARSVILAEATKMRADLIAMGTHGRSGLAHWFLGSVAEWALVNARVDVLVARPVRFTFELP